MSDAASLPPPLPADASRQARPLLSAVLSGVLLLFVASAVVSFLDFSLLLFWERQDLSALGGILLLLMLLAGIATYLMMALSPAIPKRLFLPVSLFLPVVYIAVLPLLARFSVQAMWIVWGVALGQLLLGYFVIRRLRGGRKPAWPLLRLPDGGFRWGNLAGMLAAAVFLLLPALLIYTALSAKWTVEHFSDGFVALRPAGVSMQVRKYERADGRKITLVPMSHVGEEDFYTELAASFPPDSVILMEGVTDSQKLANTRSDYSKMATSIGAVEQTQTFKPRGEIVAADVDMSSFSPETLGLLKTAMLVHAKGVTAETLPILMKPTPPGLEKQLMDDILTKRNRHLLGVIRERLPTSENLIVPWGAAHMPEIAREIQKLGFRVVEKREVLAIRFGS